MAIFHPHNYFLNAYFLPPLIICLQVLVFGLVIIKLEKKSHLYHTLSYFFLSAALWLAASAFLLISGVKSVAVFWMQIQFVGLILLAATTFHVSTAIAGLYGRLQRLVIAIYLVGIGLMLLLFHPHFFESLRYYWWGLSADVGRLSFLFWVYVSFCFALSLVSLIRFYRQLNDKIEQALLNFIIPAFVLALFTYGDVLSNYGVSLYPVGYLPLMLSIFILFYGVIHYEDLKDQQLAVELDLKVKQEAEEISKVVNELKAAQLKMFETGKISVLASLSAGILHQISQPITAIHGFVKFMKKEMSPTDRFYKAISLMEEQSVYLREMVEDLMELIRHREIKKEEIDINAAIQRSANLLTDELRIRRVNWVLELSPDLPHIYADAVHLQQVFMNIIVNALQALSTLPKGADRKLHVVSKMNEEKDRILIEFEDNGPGLTEEDQKQLFEPFFSTKTKGAGIGLALCKDLISEHGGDISASNLPQGGVVFRIRLPHVASQNNHPTGVESL